MASEQSRKRRRSLISICLLTSISLLVFTTDSFSKTASSGTTSVLKVDKLSLDDALQQADQAVANKNYTAALNILQTALQSQNNTAVDPGLAAKAWYRMARISRTLAEHYSAIDQLTQAANLVRKTKDKTFLATILHDLGATFIIVGDYDSAIGVLTEAAQSMKGSFDNTLSSKIEINLVHALLENGVSEGLEQRLNALYDNQGQIRNKKENAELLLSVGHLYRMAQKKFNLSSRLRTQAYKALSMSLETATSIQDSYISAYANGFIGQLYEDEARYDEAMEYSRKAIFHAQSINANESLFKWEWQVARLLKAQNKIPEALDAYRQTGKTFKKVRLNILLGAKSNFQRYIAPFYYQFVGLLLKEATAESDPKKRLVLRHQAVKVLEKYKLAEVEDYFQSACIDPDASNTQVSDVDPYTAVIYPIVLEDRLELIVSVNNKLAQFVIPVKRKKVMSVVRSFREKIEQPGSKTDYQQDAKTLYSWLVEPYLGFVKESGIKNLLFVPDGPVRSIPMAALHDGEKFLIESFTTASTPSLLLTSLHKQHDGAPAKVLLNGVTKAVQGYGALPSVDKELQNISNLYPSIMLKNEEFTMSRAEKELSEGSYSIVHIATHGEFSSDYRNSYLLTYDSKLTMAKLEETIGIRKYKQDPLDLLVLSACQTAVGDDRAALGLAGVAIKAGARSAIATLWFISDKATSQLVSEFYQQLQQESVTKAEALKNAQLSLINSENRQHPYYWAPFLLIGNWL